MIGVLAIQGDVSEHYNAVRKAVRDYNLNAEVKLVRRARDMEGITHLIIPGGESTTISRIMDRNGLREIILEMTEEGELAVMGTCAGSILMAREVVDDDRVKPLGLINMRIIRNAFGRQRDSFEADVHVEGVGTFHAVFIRAPTIQSCSGNCEILSRFEDRIIMVREKKHIALVFHPELTDDSRIYRLFLEGVPPISTGEKNKS